MSGKKCMFCGGIFCDCHEMVEVLDGVYACQPCFAAAAKRARRNRLAREKRQAYKDLGMKRCSDNGRVWYE